VEPAANLIATPLAPIPPGDAAEWVEGAGGLRLRAALFPAAAARGSVIVSPGRTEPIEKYFEVVEDLRGRGFTVLVHDWRGHGLSGRLHRDPMRGHADGLGPFLEDHRRLLDAFAGRLPRPWIGLGHSMGGGLTALAVVEGEARLDGLVLSSPMMGVQLGAAPIWLARALAAGFSRLGGGGTYAAGRGDPFGGTYPTNILTHDRARFERTHALLTAAPQLQLGGVTWAWLDFALKLSRALAASGPVAVPMAVVAAGDERLVDNAASRAFAERAGARYVEIDGAYHELLMETDAIRDRFWAEFDAVAGRGRRPRCPRISARPRSPCPSCPGRPWRRRRRRSRGGRAARRRAPGSRRPVPRP
jgi:lysophospholipase